MTQAKNWYFSFLLNVFIDKIEFLSFKNILNSSQFLVFKEKSILNVISMSLIKNVSYFVRHLNSKSEIYFL